MTDLDNTVDTTETAKRTMKASFDPIFENDAITGCRVTVKGEGGGVVDVPMADLQNSIVGNLFVSGVSVKSKLFYNEAKTPADVLAGVREFLAQMLSGVWNAARETGGVLVRAYAEAVGISVEAAREKLDGLTAKQKDLVKANPKVAPIYTRMISATTSDDDKTLSDLGL